jgi:predicted amidohydrolase YtcJ
MFADLVLINGKIVTMDDKESIAEAVAVKFGKILAVGSNNVVKKLIGAQTKVIDLEGRTVIPGLIDSHCHIISAGISSTMGIVDLSEESGVKSISDIKAKIAEKARDIPKGEWIICVHEDDSKLVEKRHPTRLELDEVAPEHPVIISTIGEHFYIVNTMAFKKRGINSDTPDPPGGIFERDPKTGELTGGIHERAKDMVMPERFGGKLPSREHAVEGVKKILMEAAKTGITCIYDTVMDLSELQAIADLKNRNELPIRVRLDINIELLPEINRLGVCLQGLGDEWIRICGLKIFLDGAISARTAAVSEPYLHKPNFYGVISTTKELAYKAILEAYGAGYRISAHANGDRAIGMFLDIMEEIQSKFPREDSRNRVVHCTVVSSELIARIKHLRLLPTIFGAYPYYHGDKIIEAFGETRLERMFAARSFLDAGVKVAAHSDYDASPFNPLMGVHALVNRITKLGKPIGQSQKINVAEALKMYTTNAAYHSFDESLLGSIEVGKCADMVVLGRDILATPPQQILDIPVHMTIVSGKMVYKKE